MNGHDYLIKASALMSGGKNEEICVYHFINDDDAGRIVEAFLRHNCCDEDSTIVEEASRPLFDAIEAKVCKLIAQRSHELQQDCLTYVWDAPAELWERANALMQQ